MSPPAHSATLKISLFRVVVWLGAALCATCSAASDDTPPPIGSPAGMQIVPSKPIFALGERITLNITLTNTSSETCQMSTEPHGVLSFVQMTHDGEEVIPHNTTKLWYEGFSSFYVRNLVELPPGKSVSATWESDYEGSELTVDMAAMYPGTNGTDVNDYAVNRPGRYELNVRYLPPPFALPGKRCQVTAARASFVVAGDH